MNLNGKTFIVVGAAGRLGKVMVDAALDCGANIVAVDQNVKALQDLKAQQSDNKRFFTIEGDITQVDSIQRLIEAAVEQFGSLDGAVNTAYPRNENYGRSFFDVTYEDFCENLSQHLGGYFLFMQQCAKYAMVNKVKFSLVNMSSIYGVMAPRFEVYAGTSMTMPVEYAAIKSALQHLGSYVSAYTKGSKFRVNCVSPGGILAGQDQAFLDRYNSYCRDKGMLEPNDIIGTILFLLSDASEYVCGQNIIVDDAFSN